MATYFLRRPWRTISFSLNQTIFYKPFSFGRLRKTGKTNSSTLGFAVNTFGKLEITFIKVYCLRQSSVPFRQRISALHSPAQTYNVINISLPTCEGRFEFLLHTFAIQALLGYERVLCVFQIQIKYPFFFSLNSGAERSLRCGSKSLVGELQ